MKVLLSIKPQFANKILSGEKLYEYRKRIFKKILGERTGICIADYKMQEEGILFDESEWCMALGDLYR